MLTEFILESLVKLGQFGVDFFDAMMLSGYSDSYKKLKRMSNPFYREFDARQKLTPKEWRRRERQRFYNLLGYLERQGLVEKNKIKNKKGSSWKITERGRSKLEKFKTGAHFRLPKSKYETKKDDTLKIVIFDIPEAERRKRDWLREKLFELGFSMLQKSVWVGKNKLPGEFMNDLKELGMLRHIEIFAVSKIGTIKQGR